MLRPIVVAALLFASAGAFAQPAARPAVAGTVLDPSGAFISGASVALAAGTKDLLKTTTDEKGEFRFKTVVPGHYQLSVEYSGFTAQRTRMDVSTRPPKPIRIIMALADLEQNLKVESSLGQVNTDAAR